MQREVSLTERPKHLSYKLSEEPVGQDTCTPCIVLFLVKCLYFLIGQGFLNSLPPGKEYIFETRKEGCANKEILFEIGAFLLGSLQYN